jgi:hypothetical protein
MMMSSQQQEEIRALNDFDWVKSAVATVVFFLQRMDQNAVVVRMWGVFAVRVHHVVSALNAVFGPFHVLGS